MSSYEVKLFIQCVRENKNCRQKGGRILFTEAPKWSLFAVNQRLLAQMEENKKFCENIIEVEQGLKWQQGRTKMSDFVQLLIKINFLPVYSKDPLKAPYFSFFSLRTFFCFCIYYLISVTSFILWSTFFRLRYTQHR